MLEVNDSPGLGTFAFGHTHMRGGMSLESNPGYVCGESHDFTTSPPHPLFVRVLRCMNITDILMVILSKDPVAIAS